MKTRVYATIQYPLPHGPSRSLSPKFEQLSCKKVLQFALFANCFPALFTEVEILYLKTFKFVLGRFSERYSKFQPKYNCF